ncbi:proteic killer suppression protein [Methylovorus glucosotrophus]|uniref:type II toxin-antitoxin system RelE/ParE family toxin n=1 Tax=Methylovorus glucosotrophus TaxID=266009 RepID=UPI00133167FB|nr:type II toxin-antitoxin system RelE/ParE family toxin [Methylovorus glucosotrophus]KAF0844264.1 proteic killer suppression protein [Methylovorus glucosotrophus]
MEIEFEDEQLERLEIDSSFYAGYPLAIVRAYRKRIQTIRAATDERAFYALKSLHFEKLVGNRVGEYSMRLNEQWRLILKFKTQGDGKIVIVISIEDYH